MVDPLCLHIRNLGQVICAIRRRLWYLRDKMHHCWFRHEGLPGCVDVADQVHRVAVGHRVWSLGG